MNTRLWLLTLFISFLCVAGCEGSGGGNGDGGSGGHDSNGVTPGLNFDSRVLNEEGEQWEFTYSYTVAILGEEEQAECSGPFRIYLKTETDGDMSIVITPREYCHPPIDLGDRSVKVDAEGNIGTLWARENGYGGRLTEDELFYRFDMGGGCMREFHFKINDENIGTMRDSISSDCTAQDAFESEVRPYTGA